MKWNEYQIQAMRTLNRSLTQSEQLAMGALGLTGEAGEVADHIKKILYHGHDMNRDELIKELGDVLWYVACLLEILHIDMDDVQSRNIAKLMKRYDEGFSNEASRNRSE